MAKLQYTVKETFVIDDPQKRQQYLKTLMEEYLRSKEKQISQSANLG